MKTLKISAAELTRLAFVDAHSSPSELCPEDPPLVPGMRRHHAFSFQHANDKVMTCIQCGKTQVPTTASTVGLKRKAGEDWMITDKSKTASQGVVAEAHRRGGSAMMDGHKIDLHLPIPFEGRESNVPLQIEIFEGSYPMAEGSEEGRLVVNAYFVSGQKHPVPTGDQPLTTAAEILDAVTAGFQSLLAGG